MTAARRIPLRAAAIVGLVLLAYNYSLMTLARGLTLQTPLAYLALVPILALGLAVARMRLEPPTLPIHDRQVDWIVGIGLLGSTAAVLILLPEPASSTFWLDRIDLLTLPLFVSGLIALLFGVRRIWALRFPILFLLLAWPLPFTWLLSATSTWFTAVTAKAVGLVTVVVPVARASQGDDTLFIIGSGAHAFGVSVGTACSGMNSFVGFLLLGAAMLFLVRGSFARRAAWLAVGLALTVSLNVLRIVGILVAGSAFGQDAAMEILHPVAGLIVFNIGVLGMIVLAPRFGLGFATGDDRPTPASANPANPVPSVRPALAVALGFAILLGVTNAAFSRYESISSGLGDARLESFDIRTAHVSGWRAQYLGQFAVARQYFGDSATWERVVYTPTPTAQTTSSRTVYVDVITTEDQGTFAAYGLQACYTFHGYQIKSVSQVDVGAGVEAQVIDYRNPSSDTDWSALWWEWPYEVDGQTRYERVVVFLADGPLATFTGLSDIAVATQDSRFAETDKFLATLGRTIVSSQLNMAASR
jgi:exosortase